MLKLQLIYQKDPKNTMSNTFIDEGVYDIE